MITAHGKDLIRIYLVPKAIEKVNNTKIHIGTFISHLFTDSGIVISRICNFLRSTANEITEIYDQKPATHPHLKRRILPMTFLGSYTRIGFLSHKTVKV